METTEIKKLRKLGKAGGERPLSAADLRLRRRVRSALMEYEGEVKGEHPAAERRCTLCGVPMRQGCC